MNTLISTIIVFLLSYTPVFAQSVVNKIVAKVDSEVITQEDVVNAQKEFSQKLATIKSPEEREKLRKENAGKTLQNIINQKLLDAELKKSNIDVSSDEVQEAVQGVAYKQNKTMNQLEASLISEGLSSQQIEENVKEDIRKNKFLQQVIFPRIRISDTELQDYYSTHKNDFKTYGQLRFSQILVTNESIEPGQDLAKIASNLAEQLKKGADFKIMAQRYSKGPFAENGGDSGLVRTSEMRKDLAHFLLQLPLNTISKPVPVQNGFFIFKVSAKADPQPMDFIDAKNDIRQKLFEAQVKDEIEKYIAEVRAKHYVEIL